MAWTKEKREQYASKSMNGRPAASNWNKDKRELLGGIQVQLPQRPVEIPTTTIPFQEEARPASSPSANRDEDYKRRIKELQDNISSTAISSMFPSMDGMNLKFDMPEKYKAREASKSQLDILQNEYEAYRKGSVREKYEGQAKAEADKRTGLNEQHYEREKARRESRNPYYGKGNVDLNHRPIVQNEDGSYETVYSSSYGDIIEGKEVLLTPILPNGKKMSDKELSDYIADYKRSGKDITKSDIFLGAFDSVDEAESYAEQLHRSQANLYGQEAALLSKISNPTAPMRTYNTSGLGNAKGKRMVQWLTDKDARATEESEYGNAASPNKVLDYMSGNEKNTMLNLAGKGDYKAVEDYFKSIERELNARYEGDVRGKQQQAAKDNPLLGVASNAAASFASPAAYLGTVGQNIKNTLTGEYESIDPNSRMMAGVNAERATRQGVNDAARGLGEKLGGEAGGNLASFLTDTGLSMAQYASKLPLGAPAALVIMSSGAAGQAANDAVRRGASASEALAIGTTSGAIEYLTEKLPLENLFKMAKGGVKAFSKDGVKQLLKQAGIEGTEELVSEYFNLLSDVAVMGERSEYAQYKQQLIQQGYSQSEAERMAMVEFGITRPALSFAGGALSGGVMGVGATAIGDVTGTMETGRAVQQSGAFNDVYQDSMKRDAGSKSLKQAQDIAKSGNVSDYKVGRLYQAYTETQTSDDVKRVASELVSRGVDEQSAPELADYVRKVITGQTVTNKQAEAVLNNDVALQYAQEATGGTIDKGATLSQQRKALQTLQNSVQRQAEVNPTKDALKTLGVNGAKAFTLSYEKSKNDVDLDTFTQRFEKYYRGGQQGLTMEQIAQAGTPGGLYQTAAFNAGQNDAATIKAAAPGADNATYFGNESGFAEESGSSLDLIGKALGVKIQRVEATGENGFNGNYRAGVISIAADAKGDIMDVAKHEITHRLKQVVPDAYATYENYVMATINNASTRVKAKMDFYAERGEKLTEADAREELVADFTSRLLNNKGDVEALVKKDMNVAQKIYNAIKRFIKKIKAALSGDKTDALGFTMRELNDAEAMWKAAFAKAQGKAEGKEATQKGEAKESASKKLYEAPEKFSMKESIEETKDLIAIHNLSPENLQGAFEIGGFPMPSIAVMKASTPHDRYGSISLLFRKETISPTDRRNKVYGGDAWTPSFPTIGYKLDGKILSKVGKQIEGIVGRNVMNEYHLAFDEDNALDYINRSSGDVVQAFGKNVALKMAYLKQSGNPMEMEYGAAKYESGMSASEIKAIYEAVPEINDKYIMYSDLEKLEPAVRAAVNEHMLKTYGFPDMHNKVFMGHYMSKIKNDVVDFAENGEKEVVDYYKTRDKIEQYFKDNADVRAEYEAWVKDIFSGLIAKRGIRNNQDWYTRSGNRRSFESLYYEYTLDNIVKAMGADISKGNSLFNSSTTLAAVATKNYKSIDEIRADKGRLKLESEEEYLNKKQEFDDRLSDIISRMMVSYKGSNKYTGIDNAAEAIQEAVIKSRTKSRVKQLLSEWTEYTITDDVVDDVLTLVKDMAEMPTEYFEAKPERAVSFDEIVGAVIPNDLNEELKDKLKSPRRQVIEYDPNKEGDRLRAVNEVEGVKFSMKDSEGRELSKEQAETFKDSKVRDAAGNLLVMYHGTPYGGYNEFKDGNYFTSNKEYADRYQNPSASSVRGRYDAATNPMTYEVYLNITKPFDTRKPSIKRIFMQEFYRKYGNGSPLLESGLPDWTDGADLIEFIQEKGYDYDGLILDEGGDGGYGEDVVKRGLSYVPISANQIKNVDNLNPTADPDIRYSMKDSLGVLLTDAQAKYFKNSKVLDKNGNLRIMYHNTNNEFTEFDISRSGENQGSALGTGFYFSSSRTAYNSPEYGSKQMQVYLNMESPYNVNTDELPPAEELYKKYLSHKWQQYPELGIDYINGKRKSASGSITLIKFMADENNITTAQLMQELGYDGIIDGGEYVVFNPNQIKDVDNLSPTSKGDINFSLKGEADYTRRIKTLKETIAGLREEFRLTKGIVFTKEAVEAFARTLREDTYSEYKQYPLVDRLTKLYDGMAANQDTESWDTAYEQAKITAKELLDEAYGDNPDGDVLSELKTYFKKTSIIINPESYAELENSDFNDFRKRNMGRLKLELPEGYADRIKKGLSTTGISGKDNVDGVYKELSEDYPQFFPDTSDYGAQLKRIETMAYEAFHPERPQMEYTASDVEAIAVRIMDAYFELPQKYTFADKKEKEKRLAVSKVSNQLNAKIDKKDEQLSAQKQAATERMKRLRSENAQRVEKVKDIYDERIKRIQAEYRDRNEKHITKLKEKYAEGKANAKERQSERELKRSVKNTVGKLSSMLLNPTDKQHIPEVLRKPVADFLDSVDMSSERLKIKSFQRLYDLSKKYRSISEKSDEYVEFDPELIDNIDEFEEMTRGKTLDEMNVKELQLLKEIVQAVYKSVKDYNKMMAAGRKMFVTEIGDAVLGDLSGGKDFQEKRGAAKWIGNMLNMDMLAPEDYFTELGGTFKMLYDFLRDGMNTKVAYTKTAADYMQQLLGDIIIDEWTGEKAKTKSYKLDNGKTLDLTAAQAMSLYLLDRQEQAKNHMLKGGVKLAPTVVKKGGKVQIVKSNIPVEITQFDLGRIFDDMSDQQKRIAEGISKFFTDYTAAWGNEVSMQLYGYKKFTEENYFPIVSDRNYVKTVFGEVTEATLKNGGSTKSRVKGANNPLMIEDAFDVFTRQADFMASYGAFVIPLTDMQKIYNYKGNFNSNNVKDAIERRLGARAKTYFTNFMRDVNGGLRTETGGELSQLLISKYKSAAIGLNLRVIIQQPTAVLRALSMIDGKYLAKGLTSIHKGDFEKVKKYSMIAQWKDWGYFSLDTGRQMKDIFLGKKTLADVIMKGVSAADNYTWARLWNAVEAEIKDTRKELTAGTEDFYKAVAKRFDAIVDRTQVVDSVFHRTGMMRSNNALVKMYTSFMSEPMKSYNMMRTALRSAAVDKAPGSKKAAAQAVSAWTVSVIVNAAAAGLIDVLRNKGDEDWLEKLRDATINNSVGAVTGMIPLVRDVASIIEGFTIERMDMAGLSDAAQTTMRIIKYFNDLLEGNAPAYQPLYLIKEALRSISQLTGVPFGNVQRDAEAIIFKVLDMSGAEYAEYSLLKMIYNVQGKTHKSKFYDVAYKAYKRDKDEYMRIVRDMAQNGIDASQVKAAIKSRIEGEAGK